MRALIVRRPGGAGNGNSAVELLDVPEPETREGDLLVETLWLGICATDRRLGRRGPRRLPEGEEWLVLGHEVVGRIAEAPPGSAFAPGELVCGIVRRPDPAPCARCASGEPDLCARGDYAERGIVGRHGYGAERFRLESRYAVGIDPRLGLLGVLVEPASIAAKAWERLDGFAGRGHRRARALVVGGGPIGMLAALLGAQRGYDVHVLDLMAAGAKPRQVAGLGATYHRADDDPGEMGGGFDVVLECAGAGLARALALTAPNGMVCLIAGGGHAGSGPDAGDASVSRDMVARNKAVFGVVSSNRRHFEAGQRALLRADRDWVRGLVSESVPVGEWERAFDPSPDAIKSVIEFQRP